MRTLAILPIKSFDHAKQRLSPALGSGSRQALAQAMFLDVLASVRRAREVEAVAVVTGDPRAQAAARAERVQIVPDHLGECQSAAAGLGIRHALVAGFERVLLVPGDTPLLDPFEVDELLRRSEADGLAVTIVPDRHGTGTNALVIAPPDAFEPSFGPDSLARHVAAAKDAGLAQRVEATASLLHDVDTPDDFAELGALLEQRHGLAPSTRGALRQLGRSKGGAPASLSGR